MFNFLDEMQDIAKRYLTYEETETFERGLRTNHRYIFCGLPDWGENYKPKFPYSLTPAEYKTTRRRLNSAMKDNRRRLWRDYKGVLFTPELNYPARNGVHLTPEETVLYAKQIALVCGRLCCTYCRIQMSDKFKVEQHKDTTLKSGRCALN